jgi:hypothetical protein
MAGIFSSFVLAGLLSASPGGVFSFDGPEVTARTVGNVGFYTQGSIPFTDLFERGTGSVELVARERIADARATYGDSARLEATFNLGGESYRVELITAGFPPAQAVPGMSGAVPPPPAQPISGGVMVGQELHGNTGLGSPNMTRVQAAAAVWGVGRVWRNGALLTDTALIHAAALSRGAHADDETFRLLPVAREGDTELHILVWNLPREVEPRGFIEFGFDDVAITINGTEVPSVADVPTAGVFAGVAPPSTAVPGGASLGLAPNSALQQQQGVGGSGQAGTGQDGTGALLAGTGQGQGQFGTGQGQFGTGQFGAGQSQFGAGQSQFGAGQGQFGVGQGQSGTGSLATAVPVDGLSDPTRTTGLARDADVTLPGPNQAQGAVIDPFLRPGRVALSVQDPNQPDVVTPGFAPSPTVPPAFLAPDEPGRVALSVNEPGAPGDPDSQLPGQQQTPFIPNGFQDDSRVQLSNQRPPPALNGFVPLTPAPQNSQFLSTNGSFSVVPLVPGVSGPEFAFGGTRVTSGVVRTPSPQQVQTPAVPLVATPQPLNAQQPVPLISGTLPLNAQPAVPLIATPPPLNSQPVSGIPPGSTLSPATAPGAAPGAVAVPGLANPGTTTGGGGSAGTAPGSVPGGGVGAPAGGAAPSP